MTTGRIDAEWPEGTVEEVATKVATMVADLVDETRKLVAAGFDPLEAASRVTANARPKALVAAALLGLAVAAQTPPPPVDRQN